MAYLFKGAALTVGASQSFDLCSDLQIMCDQNQLQTINAVINDILQCHGETVRALVQLTKIKNQMLDYQ